jgi:hypothetical protein
VGVTGITEEELRAEAERMIQRVKENPSADSKRHRAKMLKDRL